MVACRRFIALGDNIDVERVDLDPATETWPAASAAIRVRPGAEERIGGFSIWVVMIDRSV
jgi:hypothetical protein